MADSQKDVLADSSDARQSILDACHTLQMKGHFPGTWGNISIRLKEGMLITPSAAAYDTMSVDDLVLVSWDGAKLLKGRLFPSSESQLHLSLYAKRPEFGGVIHTHSTYLTAISCTGKPLPVCVEDMAQICGGQVNCTEYIEGSHHKAVAEAACAAIGEESFAVLLSNHGAVVAGRTLAEAVTAVEILEKAAKAYIFASVLGSCRVLPEDAVRNERERFLHKYGRVDDSLL